MAAPSRFWVFWIKNTIKKVTMVVPVLMINCQVSENPNSGPVTAHTTDKIDKRFLPGRGIFPTARATSWRSAAHRLKAPPGSLLEPCWIEAPARLLLWRALAPGFDEILVALLGLPGDMRLLVPQFLDIVGIG